MGGSLHARVITLGLALTKLLGVGTAQYFVDRVGRRILLLSGTVVMIACLVAFTLIFKSVTDVNTTTTSLTTTTHLLPTTSFLNASSFALSSSESEYHIYWLIFFFVVFIFAWNLR